MGELHFSLMIYCLQRYVERRQSVQVLVFPSAEAAVGNGSIKSVIFVRRLGCLNVEMIL